MRQTLSAGAVGGLWDRSVRAAVGEFGVLGLARTYGKPSNEAMKHVKGQIVPEPSIEIPQYHLNLQRMAAAAAKPAKGKP